MDEENAAKEIDQKGRSYSVIECELVTKRRDQDHQQKKKNTLSRP